MVENTQYHNHTTYVQYSVALAIQLTFRTPDPARQPDKKAKWIGTPTEAHTSTSHILGPVFCGKRNCVRYLQPMPPVLNGPEPANDPKLAAFIPPTTLSSVLSSNFRGLTPACSRIFFLPEHNPRIRGVFHDSRSFAHYFTSGTEQRTRRDQQQRLQSGDDDQYHDIWTLFPINSTAACAPTWPRVKLIQ